MTLFELLIILFIIIGIPIIILTKSLKKHKHETIKTVQPTQHENTIAKYCSTCGNKLYENAVVCPNCGCAISSNFMHPHIVDTNSTGLNVLSFLSPLLGLILYLLLKDDKPIKAKGCKKFALTSLITLFIVIAIMLVLLLILFIMFSIS